MKPAIRVENLSKQYRIGQRSAGEYRTLRESLMDALAAPIRKLRGRGQNGNGPDRFWALQDVSFDVQPGEVVGIIGRNGAGKSTLLKILSRIVEPTKGRAEVRGRIGSLLEVGTGFHQELTGRENIYLNGSILGMTRREIQKKFDEIVAFSEIEQFLDTPVKRYSSGMYVRLAFAVAAHLDPEILMVDEVLAVGDATFQKKCLGHMEQFASGGRTAFLVSHQMAAIRRLCSHVIWLNAGRLMGYGPTEKMVSEYLRHSNSIEKQLDEWIDCRRVPRSGSGEARFTAIRCRGPKSNPTQVFPDGELVVDLQIESDSQRSASSLAVTIYDRQGTKLVNADTVTKGMTFNLQPGLNEFRLTIRQLHLTPGQYIVGLWLANMPQCYDYVAEAASLDVCDSSREGFGNRPTADGLVTSQFHVVNVPTAC